MVEETLSDRTKRQGTEWLEEGKTRAGSRWIRHALKLTAKGVLFLTVYLNFKSGTIRKICAVKPGDTFADVFLRSKLFKHKCILKWRLSIDGQSVCLFSRYKTEHLFSELQLVRGSGHRAGARAGGASTYGGDGAGDGAGDRAGGASTYGGDGAGDRVGDRAGGASKNGGSGGGAGDCASGAGESVFFVSHTKTWVKFCRHSMRYPTHVYGPRITVLVQFSRTHQIDIDSWAPVSTLKRKIFRRLGIPVDSQRLLSNSRCLNDKRGAVRRVCDFISDGDIVIVALKLPGGMFGVGFDDLDANVDAGADTTLSSVSFSGAGAITIVSSASSNSSGADVMEMFNDLDDEVTVNTLPSVSSGCPDAVTTLPSVSSGGPGTVVTTDSKQGIKRKRTPPDTPAVRLAVINGLKAVFQTMRTQRTEESRKCRLNLLCAAMCGSPPEMQDAIASFFGISNQKLIQQAKALVNAPDIALAVANTSRATRKDDLSHSAVRQLALDFVIASTRESPNTKDSVLTICADEQYVITKRYLAMRRHELWARFIEAVKVAVLNVNT